MSAKEIADKYVERGGYLRGERRERLVDDLRQVFDFIGWHDDDHMMGGVRAKDAFDAACRILNIEAKEMRKIVRGE